MNIIEILCKFQVLLMVLLGRGNEIEQVRGSALMHDNNFFFFLYVKFMRSGLLVINTFTFQFSENFKSKRRANTIKYLNNALNKTLKINVPLAGEADNLCGIQRQFRGVRYRRFEYTVAEGVTARFQVCKQ